MAGFAFFLRYENLSVVQKSSVLGNNLGCMPPQFKPGQTLIAVRTDPFQPNLLAHDLESAVRALGQGDPEVQ